MVDRRRQRARWYFPGAAGVFLVGALTFGLLSGGPVTVPSTGTAPAWAVHQITVGSSGAGNLDGADGVDLSDVDGDGLLDVTSGYEQGLRATLSFNPGPSLVESEWPKVTFPAAGNLCSAEDVIIADLDGDGAKDVIAACETGAVRVTIFFAPAPPNTRSELLTASNWTQVDITASAGNRSMRAAVANLDGDPAMELLVGGKESSGPCVAANVGYYDNATPTDQGSWASATFEAVRAVGWVMQMYAADLNGDTFTDIVYSDREPIDCPTPGGTNQGITWLEGDGAGNYTPHAIIASEGDHTWFTLVDWDGDTDLDITDCRSNASLNVSQVLLNNGSFAAFTPLAVAQPTRVGRCQHFSPADFDDDGILDAMFSYNNAPSLSGVAGQRNSGSPTVLSLARAEVSGVLSPLDTKFDNMLWADVDGDGDIDAVTSEQHVPAGTGPGLGVVYFENPTLTFVAPPPAAEVSCTSLTAGSSTTDGTVFTTASISPAANAAIYVAVQSAVGTGPAAPATTGNSLTYAQEETVTFSTRRLTVFRAMGASPSTGAITFTFGVSQTSAIWSVIQCTGVDTGGTNASAATVQSVTATATGGTTLTTTLAALGGATNRIVTWVGLDISSTVTPDADFLEITDGNVAAGASTLESETALNQTQTTPTFSTANAGAISIEVKIAP